MAVQRPTDEPPVLRATRPATRSLRARLPPRRPDTGARGPGRADLRGLDDAAAVLPRPTRPGHLLPGRGHLQSRRRGAPPVPGVVDPADPLLPLRGLDRLAGGRTSGAGAAPDRALRAQRQRVPRVRPSRAVRGGRTRRPTRSSSRRCASAPRSSAARPGSARPPSARPRPAGGPRGTPPPSRTGPSRTGTSRRADSRTRPPRGVRSGPVTTAATGPEFHYSDLLPTAGSNGADETPYRLITTEGVSTFEADGRTFLQGRARGDPPAHRGGDARHRPLPAARPPRPAAQDPRRPRGLAATTGSSRSTCSRTPTSPPAACCRCARTPAPRS